MIVENFVEIVEYDYEGCWQNACGSFFSCDFDELCYNKLKKIRKQV